MRDWSDPDHENPALVAHALTRLVQPAGRLGIVGVFLPNDTKPQGPLETHGDLAIPWAELFRQDITIGMGRDHDKRGVIRLRELNIAGHTNPGVIVSQRLPLAAASTAYERFDRREAVHLEVVLDPRKA